MDPKLRRKFVDWPKLPTSNGRRRRRAIEKKHRKIVQPNVSLDNILVSALDENLTASHDIETNKSAVLQMFMQEWLESFESDSKEFTSPSKSFL